MLVELRFIVFLLLLPWLFLPEALGKWLSLGGIMLIFIWGLPYCIAQLMYQLDQALSNGVAAFTHPAIIANMQDLHAPMCFRNGWFGVLQYSIIYMFLGLPLSLKFYYERGGISHSWTWAKLTEMKKAYTSSRMLQKAFKGKL
jgi:hypothetical protein